MKVILGMACTQFFLSTILWVIPLTGSMVVPTNGTNSPVPKAIGEAADAELSDPLSISIPQGRRKRYISSRDMSSLLDYHNRVRSQVFPPAANMEYMVWDERLAKSAESWASQCVWEHGPPLAMKFMGQNLAISSGRYRSILELVRSWHDEKHSFSYPSRCSGSVCSHYTQMVWASTNRVGCAMNRCSNMNVFGSVWRKAVLLVCNYSIKGNWVGEAPYRTGRPCSACPPSYGGTCSNNLCGSALKSNKITWF
ncbi:R3H domain containing-like [Brienomyrus brachyistius]|uniref:R3H domain containing-like n=1 Tax=Brienomyrus brachyistius TaxID=42636 RepID=UPI0020B3DB5C|nr:R3H domain containing-like [Brienomyrus brachyistius]